MIKSDILKIKKIENFDNIYMIKDARFDDINSLDDFGAIMAQSVVDFFSKEETDMLISKFEKAGVNLNGLKKELDSEILKDKTFVITGSFDNYSRSDITKLIEKNGGKVSGSISKKTSFLIAGEDAGSKLSKAESLSIPIISVEHLEKMILA